MNIRRFELFDMKYNSQCAKVQIDCNFYAPNLEFKSYIPYAWMDGKVIDKKFECEGYVKWDACSHLFYSGQDFENKKDKDSYYHRCGVYSYLDSIMSMQLILELAALKFGDKFGETEELIKLRKMEILRDCIIKEVEIESHELEKIIENW